MKLTRPRYHDTSDQSGLGPQLGFAVAILAGLFVWTGLVVTVSTDIVMPIVATLLLVFAAGFGLIAWRYRGEDSERVTYADVAGALTLIGLCAAATLDADQLVRIVAASGSED